MQEHHLSVTRTARYFTMGASGDEVREVWFVLHGYGQLAAFFIRHFKPLDEGHRLFVAPEGLSRFYLQNGLGRVGATWMTREDRLHEIDDYVRYLDDLYDTILASGIPDEVTVHLLAFSQGCATATRWAGLGKARFDRVTLWAGEIAHDLDLDAHGEPLRQADVTLVVGTEDEYINADRLAKAQAHLDAHAIGHRLLTFPGPHRLDAATLQELASG